MINIKVTNGPLTYEYLNLAGKIFFADFLGFQPTVKLVKNMKTNYLALLLEHSWPTSRPRLWPLAKRPENGCFENIIPKKSKNAIS